MTTLPDIARNTAAAHAMLAPDAPVVALVSGGADSTALLRLLAAGGLGPVALSVLHVDHMLRGEASSADAVFVEELCEQLGIACRVVRFDVAAHAAEERLNLEDAGRRVRYRFAEEELDARCDSAGAAREDGRIAVAHTLDDRVETFLMRVATGAGAGALASIRPVRGRVIRPLLDVRRDDVCAYLRELGQPWREDATNADVSRTRSRVRHDVVPRMLDVNPRFPETLSRTLALLAEEDAFLEGLAAEQAEGVVVPEIDADGTRLRVDRVALASMPRPLARRALRRALFDAFPEASRLEAAHVEALLDGASTPGAFFHDLPDGLRASSEYGMMMLGRSAAEVRSVAPCLLTVPGEVGIGAMGTMTAEFVAPAAVDGDPFSAYVDASTIPDTLTVDPPRPGDRIRPLGMSGTRKLSDLLIDAKVPRRLRGTTPVVRSGDGVVWVAGVRLSDDHRVRPGTERVVRLT